MKKRESYLLEGMSCSLCESKVEQTLKGLSGITNAKADLKTSSVSLEYESDDVGLDVIKSSLSHIGYKIVGQQAHVQKRQSNDEAVS
jgi:copper chaperone CopZ